MKSETWGRNPKHLPCQREPGLCTSPGLGSQDRISQPGTSHLLLTTEPPSFGSRLWSFSLHSGGTPAAKPALSRLSPSSNTSKHQEKLRGTIITQIRGGPGSEAPGGARAVSDVLQGVTGLAALPLHQRLPQRPLRLLLGAQLADVICKGHGSEQGTKPPGAEQGARGSSRVPLPAIPP